MNDITLDNITRNWKEALRKILQHAFCRFGQSEHQEKLDFNAKPFGYFRLTLLFCRNSL